MDTKIVMHAAKITKIMMYLLTIYENEIFMKLVLSNWLSYILLNAIKSVRNTICGIKNPIGDLYTTKIDRDYNQIKTPKIMMIFSTSLPSS